MRALQMDPVGGNPQRWAQSCFYLCTYAIIFQTCIALFLPLVLDVEVKGKTEKTVEGDLEVEVKGDAPMLAKGLTIARFVVMFCLYTGAVAVVCSVFTIEHPDGAEHTLPLSPTMQCVVNLSFQYFFIYALVWVFQTVEDLTKYEMPALKAAVESAKVTVEFAPMLCVLFIATRMRALQITENKGSPQGWAQDGMYCASWALLIQFFMCLVMPIFTNGQPYQVDSIDGEKRASKSPVENTWGQYIVTTIRYLALIFLYVGLAAVITSVFLITAETANGRGSIPIVGDGTLGVDLVPGAPPMADDVPGVAGAMEATGSTIGSGAEVVEVAQ